MQRFLYVRYKLVKNNGIKPWVRYTTVAHMHSYNEIQFFSSRTWKKKSSLTDVLFLSCLQSISGTLSLLLASCFLKAAVVFSKPSLIKTVLPFAEVARVMKSRMVSFEERVTFTTLLRDLCTVSAFVLSNWISLSWVELSLVWAWSERTEASNASL